MLVADSGKAKHANSLRKLASLAADSLLSAPGIAILALKIIILKIKIAISRLAITIASPVIVILSLVIVIASPGSREFESCQRDFNLRHYDFVL
jgi:hypothetical protein